jgi:crotonobetainyl-CoA:carnitine CoA-transferase CaiB-like acyl-CoA transferase
MKEARVPSGPIYSVKDIYMDPQFRARGMIQRAAPPEGARVVAFSIFFSLFQSQEIVWLAEWVERLDC